MKTTNTNTQPKQNQEPMQKANQIKLGIDIHAASYRVVRQVDGATPQPAQKFAPEAFLMWVAKQLTLANNVYSCYEAGSFGYGLHRQLTGMGVKNFVVHPQKLDVMNKGVKTDKTDALALTLRLDRYVNGNKHALAVIRVPTVQEEEARAVSRHRAQLCQHRQRLEQQGRSLLLYNGLRSDGRWWKPLFWKRLLPKLSPTLLSLLTITRDLVLAINEKIEAAALRIQAEAVPQPFGFGALTSEVLRREMGDWNRFQNRRQVASITGMCPGVYSSGNHHRQGSITKHGNPRLRAALVELAWRVARWQPQYPALQKWRRILRDKKAGGAARKRAIVAVGRRLAIDLWRLNTGRATAPQLGLFMLGEQRTGSMRSLLHPLKAPKRQTACQGQPGPLREIRKVRL
jgi:transposase